MADGPSLAEVLFMAMPNTTETLWRQPHGLDPVIDSLRQCAYDQMQAVIAHLGYEPEPRPITGRHALPWLSGNGTADPSVR